MTRTPTAKRKAKLRNARRAPRAGCPTPHKQNLTRNSAPGVALGSSARSGQPIRYYRCPCGAYHLTSKVSSQPKELIAA